MIRRPNPSFRVPIGSYNNKRKKRHKLSIVPMAPYIILFVVFIFIICLYIHLASILISESISIGNTDDARLLDGYTAAKPTNTSTTTTAAAVASRRDDGGIIQKSDVGLKVHHAIGDDFQKHDDVHSNSQLKYTASKDKHRVDVKKKANSNMKEKKESNKYNKLSSSINEEEYVDKGTMKHHDAPRLVLKAYIEPIKQHEWDIQPLPTRNTKSTDLRIKEFPEASSCTKLIEQWPTDEDVAPTNSDPFLPWIHDVFPTVDGKFIQFVAQNKRRCQTGKQQSEIKKFMQPNVALFQHVPVKRMGKTDDSVDDGQQRYRLSTHEEADEDGIETRFICRFKPSMEETLSVFNFNYDYNTFRKGFRSTFTKEGFDDHVWTSQHLFRCPVPKSLHDTIRSGSSVFNDYATQFVDLIPIRTPPRYIRTDQFLPPRFGEEMLWNATAHYGSKHILPKIEDSGRWENIPICKPSLMTYPDEPRGRVDEGRDTDTEENNRKMIDIALVKEKKHKLIACTWTSAGFYTRGERSFVNDGSRRLLQWVMFNKLVGVDHVYIYDNSAAVLESETLEPITDLFPGFVTRINWPCKVCNNNKSSNDNKPERSSQYAAESSCLLRFGAHSDWLAAFDTDEYPVPMGDYGNLKDLLHDMDKEDIRIVNFASMRSKPRLQFLNSKKVRKGCNDCFDPSLSENITFLEGYNCNRERPPRKALVAAEKQIYRTDYVLQHFVHYSAITAISALSEIESKNTNFTKYVYASRYKESHLRYTNETTEATMLHTKAIITRETSNWYNISMLGKYKESYHRVGIEFPPNADYDEHNKYDHNMPSKDKKFLVEIEGRTLVANCFPIEKIDRYWVPKLNAALSTVLDNNTVQTD